MFMRLMKTLLPCGFVQWYRDQRDLAPLARRFDTYSRLLEDGRFICKWEDRWLCPNDATGATHFDAHYIYHPAWALRRIYEQNPAKHVDISSKIDFVAMLSAFVSVEFYDYRPVNLALSQLTCAHADIVNLPFADDSVLSISCMHVVEHIGLERYGDSFDPQGDLKAIRELSRVLAPSGHLYFVVPLGQQAKIQYNAHRIYTIAQVLEYFDGLKLEDFSFVSDSGVFIENARVKDVDGNHYGCGCFDFVKC